MAAIVPSTGGGFTTATDSSEIDFTISGRDITANLIDGSIGATRLDFAVNTSLSLANSALQPSTIGVTVQGYSAVLAGISQGNDGQIINGVAHFVRNTTPTVRVDGSALVVGDRWYKSNTGNQWFWNGTYWLSEPRRLSFGGVLKMGSYTLTAGSSSIVESGGISVAVIPEQNGIFVESFSFTVSNLHSGTLDASNNFSLKVSWGFGSSSSSAYLVDSINKFNSGTFHAPINNLMTVPPSYRHLTIVTADIVGSPSLGATASWNQANIIYRDVLL